MDDDNALTWWEERFPMRSVLFAALALPVLVLSMYYTGVGHSRCTLSNATMARMDISQMVSLIQSHVQTTGSYPWRTASSLPPLPPDGNLFPACFDALRAVDPAWPAQSERIVVRNGSAGFRLARPGEIHDVTIDRYFADPWGEPYVLRERRPRRQDSDRSLCGFSFDLYSKGLDGIDQTRPGANAEESDDIGNW